MTEDMRGTEVMFNAAGLPPRRVEWILRRLIDEIESAVAFVVAAHPDVKIEIDGHECEPDQRANEVDVIGMDALVGGAADGRTTDEIAASAGLPRSRVQLALSHPRSGLVEGPDHRWRPKNTDQ